MSVKKWVSSKYALLVAAVLVLLILLGVNWIRSRGVPQTMKGSVTVMDPAHNGVDLGTSCSFNGVTVAESFATYDVAERVKNLVEERGGTFISTLWNGGPIDDTSPSKFKNSTPAKFTLDSTIATSDSLGIWKRIETVRRAKIRYPDLPIYMVTLHHARLREDRVGVRIIHGSGAGRLVSGMDSAFRSVGYINEGTITFRRSDYSDSEIRSLGVLGSSNPVSQKIILVLGNSRNPRECRDMADHKQRQIFAELIVEGLEKAHQKK